MKEVYAYDVKYWTLEQAEAYPFWPPTEGENLPEYEVTYHIETANEDLAAASAPADAGDLTVTLVDDPDEIGAES